MSTTELQPADAANQLEQKATGWVAKANDITIVTGDEANGAAELLLGIKALRDEAESHHRPIIRAAHETHKLALAALNKIDEPLEKAERIIKLKISTWQQAEHNRIEEENRRLREEEERRRAEELERELEIAEADGATPAEVHALIEQAAAAPVILPVAQRTVPKVTGVTSKETWSAEITDIRALCKAVAEGRASTEYVTANMTALNGMARAQRSTMNVPGVRAVRGLGIAAGRR